MQLLWKTSRTLINLRTMIGDKLLLERFRWLYTEGNPYLGQLPFGPIVQEKIDVLWNAVNYGGEESLYRNTNDFQSIWIEAIRDSIICLRSFDTREQRAAGDKPSTFGVKELNTYFTDYSDFESVLYGSTKYYRDHVLHVVRVWLLGISILTENNFVDSIKVGDAENVSNIEKFSMWTIIALTHDLGYPLEKASQIISVTRNMMGHFITNPVINMDFKFTGVQDTMNDFIIKLMSSKMTRIDDEKYHNHIQSKYYFKFLKSLEDNKHGVLSAIVIYKMLEYFLESDFNLSEDYVFGEEDKRQFYLRRDVLRAISSHTCESIYQNDLLNFSFLLILCDECQEWGRRSFSSMYKSSQCEYSLKDVSIIKEENLYKCVIKESYEKITDESLEEVTSYYGDKLQRQFEVYSKWFRDGQNINKRNFTFRKEITVEHNNGKYGILSTVVIDKQGKPSYIVTADGKTVVETPILMDFKNIFVREFTKSIQNNKPM